MYARINGIEFASDGIHGLVLKCFAHGLSTDGKNDLRVYFERRLVLLIHLHRCGE